MAYLASWIRDSDEADFLRFFSPHAGLTFHNARLEPVDIEEMDGLLISGGPDISPGYHNVPVTAHELILDAEPERDAWEFATLRRALERGIPLLCICKGMQVLNLALGGTLHLDIAGHNLPEQKRQNSQLLRYSGAARHRFDHVNSSHHQAVDQLAAGLEVEAWSAADDVIEQVRLTNYPWALSVQYHPERDAAYAPLFEDFIWQVQDHATTNALRTG